MKFLKGVCARTSSLLQPHTQRWGDREGSTKNGSVVLPKKSPHVFRPSFSLPPKLRSILDSDNDIVIRNYKAFGAVSNPNPPGVRSRTAHIVESDSLQIPPPPPPDAAMSEFEPLDSGSDLEEDAEPGLVEVGYISSVHGLKGEVRVQSSTDFHELRFSKPGRRWLRQKVSGREAIREIELLQGRRHPGQKSWIVKFNKVSTVDLAQLLIGSTILVSEEDKPELEEGEFYSHDLLGMRVILKETGQLVGTVVNIINTGASDLLHVMLNSDSSACVPLVWLPFVEAIVPNVDMNKREMLITPPKGLLDLNIPSDKRSKKERRQV